MLTRFSQYCQAWIQEAPVWNWWLKQFDRRYSTEIPEGIIATWYHGRPLLLFHPAWLEHISAPTFRAELEHAVTHFILGHPSYYLAYSNQPGIDKLLDAQVAYHLGHWENQKEEDFLWLASLSEGASLPIPEIPADLRVGCIMHLVWLDQKPQEKEVNALLYKQMLQRATTGDPSGFPTRLEGFLRQSSNAVPISWQQILRRFTWRYGRKVMAYSNHRKSKRYGSYPGIKHRKKGRLLVALDTSGSVEEPVLRAFFAELNNLYRLGISLEVIESDYQIQRRYTFAGRIPATILGRGGTDFNPVFRYIRDQRDYDALIYFTDGLAPPPQIAINTPVLWVIFGENNGNSEVWDRFPGQKLMIHS